ncbi:hypothetical protein [Embleya sp. NPDC059237]|uniref:hypothetical protein n=1 Tax=Embleya sp. NPDC059237 TaxID=3346784 RepID=UPI0036870DFC
MDRDAYMVCVVELLYRALDRRDVFASLLEPVVGSAGTVAGRARWEAMRADDLH